MANDSSDQEMTENLKAERDYTAQIIHGTPSLVVGIDPEGITRFVNPAIEKVSGYAKEELIGKNWWETLYPGEEYTQVEQLFKDFEKGAVRDYEMTLTTKDGGKRIIAWNSLNRFNNKGELVEVIGFGNDLTARIRVEQELKAQQAVAASSMKMSALGEMAGGIAHEINTPLATIAMLAGQMKDILEEGVVDQKFFGEAVSSIEATTFRISKIIKALRTFSRNADSDPFAMEKVSAIIDDTLALCQEKFKHRSIQLRVDTVPDSVELECQLVQISQVLLNLLNNAVDAVESLPEKWVSLEIQEDPTHIHISVTDSGRGLPSQIASKIMQPFFTTKELGKGTGLGLSISQGIVEAHNGRLHLDPSSEHTRFLVSLPKKQKKQLPE